MSDLDSRNSEALRAYAQDLQRRYDGVMARVEGSEAQIALLRQELSTLRAQLPALIENAVRARLQE